MPRLLGGPLPWLLCGQHVALPGIELERAWPRSLIWRFVFPKLSLRGSQEQRPDWPVGLGKAWATLSAGSEPCAWKGNFWLGLCLLRNTGFPWGIQACFLLFLKKKKEIQKPATLI